MTRRHRPLFVPSSHSLKPRARTYHVLLSSDLFASCFPPCWTQNRWRVSLCEADRYQSDHTPPDDVDFRELEYESDMIPMETDAEIALLFQPPWPYNIPSSSRSFPPSSCFWLPPGDGCPLQLFSLPTHLSAQARVTKISVVINSASFLKQTSKVGPFPSHTIVWLVGFTNLALVIYALQDSFAFFARWSFLSKRLTKSYRTVAEQTYRHKYVNNALHKTRFLEIFRGFCNSIVCKL